MNISSLQFFVWADVAIVWIACLVPLAGCLLDRLRGRPRSWAWLPLSALILLLAPWTYTQARCRHGRERLGELLQQSRFGEARTLAHKLLMLDSERHWNGRPLDRLVAELDAVVERLAAQAATPLSPDTSDEARLDRGRQLAMLGRDSQAVAVLQAVDDPQSAVLIGTILQNQGDWKPSQEAFFRGRAGWQQRPSSTEQADGLAQSIAGVAYCQRKSGNYVQAEATYRELLAMAPTAETHFLLAQFYEDSQQAKQAELHARQAMILAPSEYQQQGQKLIAKLKVYQFGCLGVYRGEPALSR